MKKIASIVIIVLISIGFAFAEGDGKEKSSHSLLRGVVLDHISGESLPGAEISVEGTAIKVYSDLDGNFEISELPPGTYNIVVSYISYRKSLVENLKLTEGNSGNLEVILISAE